VSAVPAAVRGGALQRCPCRRRHRRGLGARPMAHDPARPDRPPGGRVARHAGRRRCRGPRRRSNPLPGAHAAVQAHAHLPPPPRGSRAAGGCGRPRRCRKAGAARARRDCMPDHRVWTPERRGCELGARRGRRQPVRLHRDRVPGDRPVPAYQRRIVDTARVQRPKQLELTLTDRFVVEWSAP
jgi:hypothetical protein